MNNTQTVVVRLDDARNGAGPGTVIAFATLDEYLVLRAPKTDMNKLGGCDPSLRLWRGYPGIAIGDRVMGNGYPDGDS